MHPKDWPLTKKRNPTIPAIGPLLPILKDWKKDPHKIVRSRRTAWRKMREALELPDNIVPKTIRHTVATQLRTRGEIGRASCGQECVSTCRSRWSPYH